MKSSYQTLPSNPVFSIDIPEVTNVSSKFFYNYYVPDEAENDKWFNDKNFFTKKSNANVLLSNPSQDFINQLSSNSDDNEYKKIIKNLQQFPRYVRITFDPPSSSYNVSNLNLIFELIKSNSLKVVSEEQFSKSEFIPINIDNGKIQQKVLSVFSNLQETSNISLNEQATLNFNEANKKVIDNALSLQLKFKGVDVENKQVNQYFESFKKVRFDSQINNNVLYDLLLQASSSYHFNNDVFLKHLENAKSYRNLNYQADISEEKFKPTIPGFTTQISQQYAGSPSFEIIGFSIEKVEFFSNGTQQIHPTIFLSGNKKNGYIDFDIRYASTYVYKVRSIAKVVYSVPEIDDNANEVAVGFSITSSLISSKPVMTYVETVETVSPPPPAELRFLWDYDRINPLTAAVDHESGKPFPGTGERGSLMLCWSFPINTQMDIKKFQIFRRKSIDDPFEIIKVFDFNDSLIKFQDLEDSIEKTIISKLNDPLTRFYDDDFHKNSEYIYCVAAIDAHGLSSNYSEQFKVRFDAFKNKLEIVLVSISGAPKQYPNLYLEKDLFVDTIKSSNKNTLNLYFTPTCYKTNSNGKVKDVVYFTAGKKGGFLINFINTDNQKISNLNIFVTKALNKIQN